MYKIPENMSKLFMQFIMAILFIFFLVKFLVVIFYIYSQNSFQINILAFDKT